MTTAITPMVIITSINVMPERPRRAAGNETWIERCSFMIQICRSSGATIVDIEFVK